MERKEIEQSERLLPSEETSPASSVFDDEKLVFDDLPDPLAVGRSKRMAVLDKALLIGISAVALLRSALCSISLSRLASIGIFLLPSWIACRMFPDVAKGPGQIAGKVHPTAWLDGLRGIAAWAVFNYHMGLDVFSNLAMGFGRDASNTYLIQLPIIRLAFSGDAAVSTFFVISGFALSIRPVKLMNAPNRDDGAILNALSSAAFRRPIRLYFPSWIATLFVILTFQWGVFEWVRWMTIEEPHRILTGYPPNLGYPFDTFWEAMYDYAHECVMMFDIFHENPQTGRLEGNHFNAPLWTIPMEFRASLMLYITQLAVSRLDYMMRLIVIGSLSIIAIWANRFEMVLFWGGFFLAELDFHLSARRTEGPRARWKTISLWSTFIAGLYVLSYPEYDAGNTPGFRTLAKMVPSCFKLTERFWPGIGGLMVVFSISRLEGLQSFFKAPLVRYLGIVSYALYVLHGMFIVYLGFGMLYATYLIFGRDSTLALGLGFITAWAVTLFATLWGADVFWRAVDIPSVTLGKNIENFFVDPWKTMGSQKTRNGGILVGEMQRPR